MIEKDPNKRIKFSQLFKHPLISLKGLFFKKYKFYDLVRRAESPEYFQNSLYQPKFFKRGKMKMENHFLYYDF